MKKDLIYIEYDLDKKSRNKIIQEQKELGNIHHGEANITEGDFLIFISKEKWIAKEIKPQRNVLLKATDYLMLADNVERLSVAEYDELKKYRQSLRDITKLDDIIFPDKPNITSV